PLYTCCKASDFQSGSNRKVGAIILAGGQGTRLGVSGPKGLFSVGGKTLFEHVLKKGGPVAIMTSPSNHEETVAFVRGLGWNACFFQQELLPLWDEEEKPVKDTAPN